VTCHSGVKECVDVRVQRVLVMTAASQQFNMSSLHVHGPHAHSCTTALDLPVTTTKHWQGTFNSACTSAADLPGAASAAAGGAAVNRVNHLCVCL
jgi:hypothetical protein